MRGVSIHKSGPNSSVPNDEQRTHLIENLVTHMRGAQKRLLLAMQTSGKYKVATPADWRPGERVIIPPPGSCGQAAERVQAGG